MDSQPVRLLRFGDYELDVRAGELRKHGVRTRLQEQSLQILLMLLERPGEVVLREEIRKRLWPNNTIVEFDHSINAAIKRLRNALLESAESARFIETLAKRGYRFVGQVHQENCIDNLAEIEGPSATEPTSSDNLDGTAFSSFRVLDKLGEGGMGVVYRADDLKLGRQVALKFLHAPTDELPPSTLERFEREARAASALNHPNICTVHTVDTFAGQPVIVMELLEGETLESRMARGRLPRDQAIAFAIQIADALAEAHRKGIVHRDLKPANVMLTKSGVKVLDFGLAKIERPVVDADHSVHRAGVVMGTLRYMSPEQAQGKDTDARTDIFSFGVIIYEMFSGRRVVAGTDGTLDPPPLEPQALDRVVRTCLSRDPADRFQSARDLSRAIEWSAATPPRVRTQRPWRMWSVSALVILSVGALAFWLFRDKPAAPAALVRFHLPLPEGTNIGTLLNVSPDGHKLAFLSAGKLRVHNFETGESRILDDGRGTPFWSPDSRFIGYVAHHGLQTIDATGAPPRTVNIVDAGGIYSGATWGRDGLIVYSNTKAIFRVPASGGVPVQIVSDGILPCFLPDGRHFLYTRRFFDESRSAIYVGSVDAGPEQQSSKPLVNSYWGGGYAPSADAGPGYLLFIHDETLVAQPFDIQRIELTGQPSPIAEQIGDGRGFSASANVLVFEPSFLNNLQLTWYDRDGQVLGTVGEPDNFRSVAISPDGRFVTLTKSHLGLPTSVWLHDLTLDTSTRLVHSSSSERAPLLSTDGSSVIFSSGRDGPFNLYQQPSNAATAPEALLKSPDDKIALSWSRDGHYLLYTSVDPKTKRDIWVLPLFGSRKPVPVVVTPFEDHNARFSPDGRWVSYESDETGRSEVYVRSFSMNSAGTAVEAGGKWQISSGCPGFGARGTRWRGDGRELYYVCDTSIMAVDIAPGAEFKPGKPKRLGLPRIDAAWDVAPDGKRFLLSHLAEAGKPQPYTVVMNWQSALKK